VWIATRGTADQNTEFFDPISNNCLCVRIEVSDVAQRKRKNFERGGERETNCTISEPLLRIKSEVNWGRRGSIVAR
jgi:hypothetical protein